MWTLAMHTDLPGFDLAAAVVAARQRAGLKHEVLALLMGITSQQLSHQLAARSHLSLGRLLMAASDPDGRRFLIYLWAEIAEFLQIESRDAVALQLRDLTNEFHGLVAKLSKRQMVKVELREERKEECA
jgi:hypothetical protein